MQLPPARAHAQTEGRSSAEGGALPRDRLLLGVQVAALLAMVATVTTRLWVDHEWLGFALAAVAALAWSPEFLKRRPRMWMALYVTGTFVYTLLRAYADDTAIPTRTDYVIDVEQALFFGQVPVVWLQGHLFDPPNVGLLGWAAVAMHWSFFVAPHALALYLFVYRRELFSRYAALVLVVLYLALLLFYILPTTPPWLAGLSGDLPRDGSYRIMEFAGRSLDPEAYDSFYDSLGEPNSVAAMPSLHLGLTFAMYLFARRHLPRLRTPLLIYSLLMGLALVYLAEHYALDLLAGAACALLASFVVERVMAGNRVAMFLDRAGARVPALADRQTPAQAPGDSLS